MRKPKLLGKIKENGLTLGEAAQVGGMSLSAFRRKLDGDSEFTRNEINALCDGLHLSNEELLAIFFAD